MKQKRKGLIWSVVLGSLAVHVAGLALFGLWVVSKKFASPAATFTVPKTVRIPVQTPKSIKNSQSTPALSSVIKPPPLLEAQALAAGSAVPSQALGAKAPA